MKWLIISLALLFIGCQPRKQSCESFIYTLNDNGDVVKTIKCDRVRINRDAVSYLNEKGVRHYLVNVRCEIVP
jgi:hypothetical protein